MSYREWPDWPQPGERALDNLADVLTSGRWTISCAYRGRRSYEQRFADAFAGYCGTRYCVPAATGTASLAIALEACGVGAHDEVLVPGLSWVASASAVLGVNAVPVLVDIDPATYCLDPAAAEAAITPRTRAITVVHAYSAVADLDALTALAEKHDLPLVEDCAHSHGARYRDRSVGSFGRAGAFSMQGSKLLTCGEGGAVITDDAEVASLAQHLRSDGRVVNPEPVAVGEMELVESGRIMGSNNCLSEFHAAVLLDQLDLLDGQRARRAENAAHLDERLTALGCLPQGTAPGTSARAHYRYAARLPAEVLTARTAAGIAAHLTAELGFPVVQTHRPLNDNPLLRPRTRRRFATDADYLSRVDPARFDLPVCQDVHESVVSFSHEILLAPEEAVEEIATAFERVLTSVRTATGSG
ncbi:DegT/DnrJ/EryC1/StrS aminotransferase family protein [Actinokineospora spheciospongiae]|uniref:DegT/DnrJ/EryC1/StrS aminotransferase family protein n=1 Tax=Actinokineospora spheciospongiae TaxID=909613 RepID=UPI000D8717A0|nr:DegT/DnrJ/EryC1/StrS family aminotransferase [Actinokineospora spheciospongiae]PWW60370.1 L-glutamine:scyllo-inosose aminotransferase/L-glutamine:2-deoxy-scyllo-inosose/3-amino-2,3-dideoxy-scyllo-inosose aminotransferase [Actinokineospora spheciospongiae]